MLLALAGNLHGQEDKAVLEKSAIEARIKALSAAPEAGEESTKAIAIYQESLAFRDEARAAVEAVEKYRKDQETAPAELEKLTIENSQLVAPRSTTVAEEATWEGGSRELDVAKAALAEARSASQEHSKKGKARVARQAELPDLIARNNSDLAALVAPEVAMASDTGVKGATYQRYLAQRDLLREQGKMLTAELEYLEATPALFAAQGAKLSRRVAALTDEVEALQAQVDRLRLAAASDEVARAKEDVARFAGKPEEEAIAQEILELAEGHGGPDGLSKRLATTAAEVSRWDGMEDRVSKQFSSAQRRVKLLEDVSLGIDASTGRLLRAQRQALPTPARLREDARQIARLSAQSQLDLIVLEERYAELLTRQVPSATKSPDLNRLWKTRLSSLRTLVADHREYIKLLTASSTRIHALIEEVSKFARFVDERLLWIPSTERITVTEPMIEWRAIRELAAAKPFAPLFADAVRNSWLWCLALVPWIYLIYRRRSLRAKLKELGQVVEKRNCTSFTPTASALGVTVLLALPIPLLLWFFVARSEGCSAGVIAGLRGISGFLSATILMQLLAHPEGMLSGHLRMEDAHCKLLRKSLGWFIPALTLPLFLTISLPIDSRVTSAGRLSFMVTVILTGVFFSQILKPSKGMVHWRGQRADRFAQFCWFLGVAVPFILVVGAAIGYYTSVQQLRLQALASVALILLTLFIAALLHRWILVSRRRFAVQQALARRAAALAERDERESEPGVAPQNVASLDEVKANAVKVVEVEEQTTRLVRAATIAVVAFGLAGIWQATIPALSALDRVTLWTEKSAPSSPAPSVMPSALPAVKSSADTSPPAGTATLVEQVTLQDLLVAVIILFLTYVAGRNVPGLVELMFFRHMHLKPGSSFAFTTTIRYVIVVCGVLIAFAKIGITWGKVQWIAAAITLGIGFGLQEIFANFVAGLIILFERPIRLGDIVTIAGVDGKVTQIRIRATTIRQFNGRELIVPNKAFITGQLVNWTLSDNELRVEVAVGLSYGSDTELARKLMLEAAAANSLVLAEPPPSVVFDAFTATSLAFMLRVYVGSVDDLGVTKTALHFAIDKAFREAGIEMVSSQSDIRIVSLPEGVKSELPTRSEDGTEFKPDRG
ncbi:MAG: mechanosensitive ion channel domain-containing protein [Verrucomicrobiota bacterium]